MASVHEACELGASTDEVWKLVRDFGGFVEALGAPVDVEGEGIGMTRTIPMGPDPTVERLEERDDDTMRLVYSIIAGPIPVTDYRGTMQLSAIDEGRTHLDWSAEFEPAAGMSGDDVVNIVSAVYKGGISALQARFGA